MKRTYLVFSLAIFLCIGSASVANIKAASCKRVTFNGGGQVHLPCKCERQPAPNPSKCNPLGTSGSNCTSPGPCGG